RRGISRGDPGTGPIVDGPVAGAAGAAQRRAVHALRLGARGGAARRASVARDRRGVCRPGDGDRCRHAVDRPALPVRSDPGAAALIYQVVFAKQLAYVFGSMSTATNTVLATYMGGMAIGAWIGGLIGSRTDRPLVVYAMCELLIAVYCAGSTLVFGWIQATYV